MSLNLNLLAFSIPGFSSYKLFACQASATYKELEQKAASQFNDIILPIVERAFNAENSPNAEHYERIQDMLKELPVGVNRDIKSLLSQRIKVVDALETAGFAAATGCDDKYYIILRKDIAQLGFDRACLPWMITHEVSHILNDDNFSRCFIKAATGFAAVAVSTFLLGLSLIPALGVAIGVNTATSVIIFHKTENQADDFAIRHCSRQELEKGKEFLEKVKDLKGKNKFYNIVTRLMHPSEDSRIAKIQAALNRTLE